MPNIQQEFFTNIQEFQDKNNNKLVWLGNEQIRYGDLTPEQQNEYDQAKEDHDNWENEIKRLKSLGLSIIDKVA